MWGYTRFCVMHSIPWWERPVFSGKYVFALFIGRNVNLFGTYFEDEIGFRTTTLSLKHHVNIQADKSFRTKMVQSKKNVQNPD